MLIHEKPCLIPLIYLYTFNPYHIVDGSVVGHLAETFGGLALSTSVFGTKVLASLRSKISGWSLYLICAILLFSRPFSRTWLSMTEILLTGTLNINEKNPYQESGVQSLLMAKKDGLGPLRSVNLMLA